MHKSTQSDTTTFKKPLGLGRLIFLLCALLFILCIGVFFAMLEPSLHNPLFVSLDTQKLHFETTTFFDKDGNPLYDSSTKIPTAIDLVPTHTIDAFVCTEDRQFFSHKGVDTRRILGATLKNIGSGGYKQGASTITQQIAKNTHLDGTKKIKRKIGEARLSKAMERKYSKKELLQIYFDILYFGDNIYGLATASRAFFDKPVQDLSVAESACLAAIINNPKLFNPYRKQANLHKRKNLVLANMFHCDKLDKPTYDLAKSQNPTFLPLPHTFEQTHHLALLAESTQPSPAPSPTLHTTIDKNLTHLASNLVSTQTPKDCQASVYCIRNDGSLCFAYSTTSANMGTTRRQIGSTIKPLLCYAPALEECLLNPITPILDQKTDFAEYTPSNYGDRYLGWTTVSQALAKSSNMVAIKILQAVGVENALLHAQSLGLDFCEEDANLSLALGATKNGFTLPQIVHAYASFANMGVYKNQKVLQEQPHLGTHIFRSDTAHLVNQMLKTCAKTGTAKRLNGLPFEVCAKTGTCGFDTHNTDAYCIAYTSTHTLGVWMGGEKMPNTITGGTLPTEIAKDLLQAIYQNTQNPPPLAKSDQVALFYIDSIALTQEHQVFRASPYALDKDKTAAEFSLFYPPSYHPNTLSPPQISPTKQSKNNAPTKQQLHKILWEQQTIYHNPYYYFDSQKNSPHKIHHAT